MTTRMAVHDRSGPGCRKGIVGEVGATRAQVGTRTVQHHAYQHLIAINGVCHHELDLQLLGFRLRRELTKYLDQDRRLDTPGLFVKSADQTLSSAAGKPSGSSRMVRCVLDFGANKVPAWSTSMHSPKPSVP